MIEYFWCVRCLIVWMINLIIIMISYKKSIFVNNFFDEIFDDPFGDGY